VAPPFSGCVRPQLIQHAGEPKHGGKNGVQCGVSSTAFYRLGRALLGPQGTRRDILGLTRATGIGEMFMRAAVSVFPDRGTCSMR